MAMNDAGEGTANPALAAPPRAAAPRRAAAPPTSGATTGSGAAGSSGTDRGSLVIDLSRGRPGAVAPTSRGRARRLLPPWATRCC